VDILGHCQMQNFYLKNFIVCGILYMYVIAKHRVGLPNVRRLYLVLVFLLLALFIDVNFIF